MTNMSAVATNKPEPIRTLVSGTARYTVQGTLGEGDYGKVFKCRKEGTGEMVAVKVLKKGFCEDTEQEAAMLQYLAHVDQDEYHLLKMHEKFDCRGNTCLAFEMLDISLWDLIRSRDCKPLSLSNIRQIAQQLLFALTALKSLGVLHTDIKPDNIMVVNKDDPQIKVKLIDFGLARRTGEVQRGTLVQPTGYRAPEVYLGQPVTEAIDMWGLGCVLAYLFTGKHFFPVHCHYQNIKYLVETVGMPDQELLDTGVCAQRFFIQEQGANGPSWRLMTHKEFEWATSRRPKMMDPSIPRLKSLADLVNMYPANSEGELLERTLFVDLLKHLLHVDWRQRLTPRQALQHPFFHRVYQRPPGVSHNESMSLSSDEAHEVVSSSSEVEFGFWSTRAAVPTPCASQVCPDGVVGEMVDDEVVSSSSEVEFGFWSTRATVTAPFAPQVCPDGVVGEMEDNEVVSSSSEVEFGFWSTRATVTAPFAPQVCPDGVVGEMEDNEVVSSSSEVEFGFWSTRATVTAPFAPQVCPDGDDREMEDNEVVSSSSEVEFGFWSTRATVTAPFARQVCPDGVVGEMMDDEVVSSSSEVEFGFWSTRATVTAPFAPQVCPDGVDGEIVDDEVVSSSSEVEFGFWSTRATVTAPFAPQVCPDGVVGEMMDDEVVSSSSEVEFGFWSTRATVTAPFAPQVCPDGGDREIVDMVRNPEEAPDISLSHLCYDADEEDNDNSDVEDQDENKEILRTNTYVLCDMYACQAHSVDADSGLFDHSVSSGEDPNGVHIITVMDKHEASQKMESFPGEEPTRWPPQLKPRRPQIGGRG